jgi:hypothetical protein
MGSGRLLSFPLFDKHVELFLHSAMNPVKSKEYVSNSVYLVDTHPRDRSKMVFSRQNCSQGLPQNVNSYSDKTRICNNFLKPNTFL